MAEKERFPGEREPDTAMPTQPGAVSGTGVGHDLPESGAPGAMDEQTKREREIEGGGVTGTDRRHGVSDRQRAITGPGAADFMASGTGEDLPDFSTTKGMGNTRGESDLANPRNLVPRLGPDTEAHPGERAPDEEKPGSATGTVGGGGLDAHNPSPVRATGVDDSGVEEDR